MLKVIKYLFVLLCTVIFYTPLNYTFAQTNANIDVYIVLSASRSIYTEVADTIIEQLNNEYLTLKTITVKQIDQEIVSLRYTPSPMVVAVGANATQEVVKRRLDNNIISILIPKQTLVNILDSDGKYGANKKNISALYLDQPVTRQINLARILVPDLKSIAIPLGKLSAKALEDNKLTGVYDNIVFDTIYIGTEKFNLDVFNELVRRNDVVLAIPDPVVHKPISAKWLLYNSYRARKPVIAFSKSYVKAGAIASVFSTPAQVGIQAAEIILERLNKRQYGSVYRYPKYFTVSFNSSVAKYLGIKLPKQHIVHDQLTALEENK